MIDDQDPEHRERILVRVLGDPTHEKDMWAGPCLLYNPCGQGGFSPPSPGSHVWIDFEQGEHEKPVWLGLCLG